MKRFTFIFSGLWMSVLVLAAFTSVSPYGGIDGDMPLSEAYERLGKTSKYEDLDVSEEQIQIGWNIVHEGFPKKKGRKNRLQSKHFKCTSCHNVVKDSPSLSYDNPQERLDYCDENGLPYLQGTSLYGAINRETFYNGDYQKKYSSYPRIKEANKDLREAIQMCAIECAQGRPLKKWELNAVLAYLSTLELKVGDLNLTEEETTQINTWINEADKNGKTKGIDLLSSKYAKAAPATFTLTPKDASVGYEGITGNPENGEKIYRLGCLHCHEDKRYSMYNLDDSKLTFKSLEHHLDKYNRYSIYQVSRYGAPSYAGKRAYMPQYSLEKMSNQQLEDLRAYIEREAE